MDEWRVELFEREHGEGCFPKYWRLGEYQAARVRARVAEVLGVAEGATDVELWRAVREGSEVVEGVNAEENGFELRRVLEELGIETGGEVMLNWEGDWSVFEVVGREAVLAYFSDLWFPSSDDLSLLDVDGLWVISVSHFGVVSFLRLR